MINIIKKFNGLTKSKSVINSKEIDKNDQTKFNKSKSKEIKNKPK